MLWNLTRKGGEIFRQVVDFIKPQVVVGAKLLDLCESIENKISELGGDIGFPPNISINNVWRLIILHPVGMNPLLLMETLSKWIWV